MKVKTITFFVAGLLSSSVLLADNTEVSVSRYVTVSTSASSEQLSPLENIITLKLNGNTKTVLEAIYQALDGSGYKLASNHPDRRVNQLFNLPIPEVHRSMGPISVSNALKAIAGEPWELVIDPVNRLITYQLPSTHQNAPLVYIKQAPAQKYKPTDSASSIRVAAARAKAVKERNAKKVEMERVRRVRVIALKAAVQARQVEATKAAAVRAAAIRAEAKKAETFDKKHSLSTIKRKGQLTLIDIPEVLR